MKKSKLILLRHGESEWNRKNIFTGWVDIPLSQKGVEEAFSAGKIIQSIPIDVIFTSTLIRAIMTAMLAMIDHNSRKIPFIDHHDEGKMEQWSTCYSEESRADLIPVIKALELNERMYGALQGLNKQKTKEKFGDEQVHIWRRSYDIAPPEGESLEMTAARTIPYFEKTIVPFLHEGKNVLISAHGNSLRSIIMFLKGLSKEEVLQLEVPTGQPIIYSYFQGEYQFQ